MAIRATMELQSGKQKQVSKLIIDKNESCYV